MAEETQTFSPPASLKRKKASLRWRGWFSTGGLAEVGGSASGRWSPELRAGAYLREFPHVLNSRTAPTRAGHRLLDPSCTLPFHFMPSVSPTLGPGRRLRLRVLSS